jgi:hypothetical protein
MVRAMVETMLGGVGRPILSFYEAHALTLNLLALTYGLILLMSWVNLVRIYQYTVIQVAEHIHLNPDLNRKSTVKRVADAISIPWQEAVDKSHFPLIANQVAFFPAWKSVQALQKIVDEQELIEHALAVLQGADPRKIRPTYKRLLAEEIARKKH